MRKAGYRVIEKWECQYEKTNEPCLTKQRKSYPHAIFYDFESLHDTTQRKEPTAYLTYEAAHVPISVSIGDTLEREPKHICDPDPKQLIIRFMEELERQGENVREAVRQEFMPRDNYFNSTNKVFVAKKANTTMFLKTEKFLFLDIINYLGPGTSYASW